MIDEDFGDYCDLGTSRSRSYRFFRPRPPPKCLIKAALRLEERRPVQPLEQSDPGAPGPQVLQSDPGARTFTGCPQRIFRIIALWLHGTTDETEVQALRVGCDEVFNAGAAPLPGVLFTPMLTFEELVEKLRAGNWPEPPPVAERFVNGYLTNVDLDLEKNIPSIQRLGCRTMNYGEILTLRVTGPLTHAVAIGATIHD